MKENLKKVWPGLFKVLIIIWMIGMCFWSKPFFYDHFQRMANSHYDTTELLEIGPILLVAMFAAIMEFKSKRYFNGIMAVVIATWAFYYCFCVGFSCQSCTFGG